MREVIQKRVVGKHQLKHHPSISVGFAKNTYFFFFFFKELRLFHSTGDIQECDDNSSFFFLELRIETRTLCFLLCFLIYIYIRFLYKNKCP